VITSPKYPGEYPNQMDTAWLIQLPPGQFIEVTFSRFELESGYNCNSDSLTIYDGHYYSSPVLGKYCGNSLPPDITSSTNQLFMKFKTDVGGQYKGFKLQYKTSSG